MENLNYTNKDRVEATSDLLNELTDICGISSDESDIALYLKKKLEGVCSNVVIDQCGNVIGEIKSEKQDAKTILLEAHMDQIGLMISGMDEKGNLKFVNVGGIDERVLPGAEVAISGEKIVDGIIFAPELNKDKNPKIDELRIYSGHTKESLSQLVKTGDLTIVKNSFSRLFGKVVSGAAMDNRAGIATILNAITLIEKEKLAYNLCVLFSTQEELGLRGAYTGMQKINADAAIIIDVTHGLTPDSKNEIGVFALGSGAVICRGPNFDYDLTTQLIKIAKENNIPYEIEVASGPSGTDAWAVQTNMQGVPSTLVSIPLRYMHSNVETLDIGDVIAITDVIKCAVEGGIVLD